MTAVITGVGVVSAFGIGAAPFSSALAEGRAAVRPIESFDASTFPTRVAGEVPVVVTSSRGSQWLHDGIAAYLGRAPASATARIDAMLEQLRLAGALRDRKISFALLAAAEAWSRAGCGDAEHVATLSIGLGLEHAFLEDFAPIFDRAALPSTAPAIAWERESMQPRAEVRFRSRVDLAARAIGELLELRGPTVVNSSACAAGALAVAHAASLIERGSARVVLCGAADSMVNPLGLGGMCRLGAPSPRNAPDACKPFDRARDGLAIGEGAAMFVVEDEARARARGARILARVLGWGSTQDAYRVTAPRPDGSAASRAMTRAIERAARTTRVSNAEVAASIGYINAHGTGTPLNDPAESSAIHAAFAGCTASGTVEASRRSPQAARIPVSSIKGAIGHLMAAAGAIELAACLLPFERDLLPGTAHHTDRDPECDLDIIGPAPRRAHVDAVLSNSFGFGGQNASVILGRPSDGDPEAATRSAEAR